MPRKKPIATPTTTSTSPTPTKVTVRRKPKTIKRTVKRSTIVTPPSPQDTLQKSGGVLPKQTVRDILNERGATHGKFETHAECAVQLRSTLIHTLDSNPNALGGLPAVLIESLTMITHTLARVANGNPLHKDHWQDIAGYAQLVIDWLDEQETK